jgi:hypothetical protein
MKPREDPRINPREDPRMNPREDPRMKPREDPRINPREDPRINPREVPGMNVGGDSKMDRRRNTINHNISSANSPINLDKEINANQNNNISKEETVSVDISQSTMHDIIKDTHKQISTLIKSIEKSTKSYGLYMEKIENKLDQPIKLDTEEMFNYIKKSFYENNEDVKNLVSNIEIGDNNNYIYDNMNKLHSNMVRLNDKIVSIETILEDHKKNLMEQNDKMYNFMERIINRFDSLEKDINIKIDKYYDLHRGNNDSSFPSAKKKGNEYSKISQLKNKNQSKSKKENFKIPDINNTIPEKNIDSSRRNHNNNNSGSDQFYDDVSKRNNKYKEDDIKTQTTSPLNKLAEQDSKLTSSIQDTELPGLPGL